MPLSSLQIGRGVAFDPVALAHYRAKFFNGERLVETGVSDKTVAKVRKSTAEFSAVEHKGLNGKRYRARVAASADRRTSRAAGR